MRVPLVPLVAALLLAGCLGFGGDDEPAPPSPTPDATPSPTPTPGSPTPSPTPTSPSPTPTPTSPTPTPTATPTPTPTPDAQDPPVEVVNTTFDYSSGEAAGPDGKTTPFTVPTGYTTLTLDIQATPVSAGGLPDLSVSTGEYEVLDPDGEVAASGVETQRVDVAAKPGEWRIVYTGTGNVKISTVGVAHD